MIKQIELSNQNLKLQTQKKAIVLFITLMFIAVLSSLIVKNLGDTTQFIEESNQDITSVKALLAVKNIQTEFLDYFVKNVSQLDTLLEAEPFKEELLLEYADVKANIKFSKYDKKHNINTLAQKEESKYKAIEELFSSNNISDFYTFKQIIIDKNKLYGSIENFIQLDSVLEEFITQIKNKDILNIKEDLSFIDTANKQLLLCKLDITVSDKSIKSNFIYDLSSKSVKGFNLAFK